MTISQEFMKNIVCANSNLVGKLAKIVNASF